MDDDKKSEVNNESPDMSGLSFYLLGGSTSKSIVAHTDFFVFRKRKISAYFSADCCLVVLKSESLSNASAAFVQWELRDSL